MKYRIVIIDDEVFVRQGIISSIDWQRHGFEMVGEAVDGNSGLEVIRAKQPHIVITDIRMPKMDGLQLIREARQQFPEMKFLILSVLEDFQFVREALQLGVNDYIPKLSMMPEELLQALLSIKQSLQTRKAQQTDDASSEPHSDRPHELQRWFNGEASSRFEWIIQQSGRCSIMMVYLKPVNHFMDNNEKLSMDDLIAAMIQNDTFQTIHHIDYIKQEQHRYAIFCTLNNAGTKAALAALARESVLRLKSRGDITVGISDIFSRSEARITAMQQALQAMDKRFYTGDGHVHVYEEAPAMPTPNTVFIDKPSIAQYFSALEQEDESFSLKAFQRLFPDQLEEGYAQELVRDEIYHWVTSVSVYVKDRGGSLLAVIGENSPFDQIYKAGTYPEMKDWCLRLHSVVVSMLSEIKSMHRNEIVKAMEYVNHHYMKPIRVKEVARLVHLNENYFSTVFAKETGKTFSQYVSEVRIEKAKQLLQQEAYTWTEVGELVGFENPKYFTKVFKRSLGVTPKQYASARG